MENGCILDIVRVLDEGVHVEQLLCALIHVVLGIAAHYRQPFRFLRI